MRAIQVIQGLGIWLPLFLTVSCAGVVRPWDPSNPDQTERPFGQFKAWCTIYQTNIVVPCAKRAEIDKMEESQCPGDRCNHVLSRHSPRDPKAAGIAVIGHLQDDHATDRLALPDANNFYKDCNTPEAWSWNYRYYSGQAAGEIVIKSVFRTLQGCPPGMQYGRFIHKSEDPASCCEDVREVSPGLVWECTCTQRVRVRYKLKELPPPPLRTWDGTPAPYVRCGLVASCDPQGRVDSPHTWESHPSVHYGTPEMNKALQCLASLWFRLCSRWNTDSPLYPLYIFIHPLEDLIADPYLLLEPQNLVITDMSLPGGGLLDIGGNWQPIISRLPCPRGPGHCLHRYGIDADLVGYSVPLDGRCGPTAQPPNTYSPLWLRTPIWEKVDNEYVNSLLLRMCDLEAFRGDPGHVRLRTR